MKELSFSDVGTITIRKSKRAKRLVMKINAEGKPIVTIPYYAPYISAELFIRQNLNWIKNNLPKPSAPLKSGTRIGRNHTLVFEAKDISIVRSRVSGSEILILYPFNLESGNSAVQKEAQKAAIRALRREAEELLPKRLHQLAKQYGYKYSEVRIKAAQTRWGSCSQKSIINLSIWLMQVPDELINYVICHELTHLHHMHHQKAFWEELAEMVPNYAALRKQLKQYQPALKQA